MPRRSSISVFPSASIPGSMTSNQHVTTETYSTDVSVFAAAPVDAHQSSSKSRRRGSMVGSPTAHRKDDSAKYEYEETGDMTFGKKEPSTRTGRRSLDVGGDGSKRGSGHNDPGPKRSGRMPRRSSISVHLSASIPGSMTSNQHVTTDTYIVSVSTASVDAHQSSSKSRRRGIMANLDAILGIQMDSSPKTSSGGRSVFTSVTEAPKNPSNGHHVEEYGVFSKEHDVSEKHESKEHRPCRRLGTARSRTRRILSVATSLSDSHDMHGVSPVEAQATEEEKTQKARSSRHRSSRRGPSAPSASPPALYHGDPSRTATGFEACVRSTKTMARRNSTGYGETMLKSIQKNDEWFDL